MKLVFEMTEKKFMRICFDLIFHCKTQRKINKKKYVLIVSVRLFKKVLLMGLMLYMRSGSDHWVITRIHNQLMICIKTKTFQSQILYQTKTTYNQSIKKHSNQIAKYIIKTSKINQKPNNIRWPTEVEWYIVRCGHQTRNS